MLSGTTASNYSAETFLQMLNGAAHHFITYSIDGIKSVESCMVLCNGTSRAVSLLAVFVFRCRSFVQKPWKTGANKNQQEYGFIVLIFTARVVLRRSMILHNCSHLSCLCWVCYVSQSEGLLHRGMLGFHFHKHKFTELSWVNPSSLPVAGAVGMPHRLTDISQAHCYTRPCPQLILIRIFTFHIRLLLLNVSSIRCVNLMNRKHCHS